MDDLITLINNAARPFKDVTVKLGEQEFHFKTRKLSAIENDELTEAFNQEFDRVSREMESGNVDITIIRRGLSRQSKPALAKLITKADRIEYLTEASSELDDKPFSDEQVKALANEKQEEAYKLLLGATEDEILEQALERRAFVVATLKATNAQNLHYLYLSLWNPDGETRAFEAGRIKELDQHTINTFIEAITSAQRGSQDINPLKPQARKPSAKRSRSRKLSVAE